MSNIEKKQRLTLLLTKNEQLKPLISKGFPIGTGQLEAYKTQYRTEFDEYYANVQEIQDLEWELMTPAEQSKKLEEQRLFRAKREGGLFL